MSQQKAVVILLLNVFLTSYVCAQYGSPAGNSNPEYGSTGTSVPSGSYGHKGQNPVGGPGVLDENSEAQPFNFAYQVKDAPTNTDFKHEAHSDGKRVTGAYSVLLPDGRNQVVIYVADENGYNAKINYERVAKPQSSQPGSQGGYPSAPDFLSAAPSYPSAAPGYPSAATPVYSSAADPGYPSSAPGFPSSALGGYPSSAPSYPSSVPGFPSSALSYPTGVKGSLTDENGYNAKDNYEGESKPQPSQPDSQRGYLSGLGFPSTASKYPSPTIASFVHLPAGFPVYISTPAPLSAPGYLVRVPPRLKGDTGSSRPKFEEDTDYPILG